MFLSVYSDCALVSASVLCRWRDTKSGVVGKALERTICAHNLDYEEFRSIILIVIKQISHIE